MGTNSNFSSIEPHVQALITCTFYIYSRLIGFFFLNATYNTSWRRLAGQDNYLFIFLKHGKAEFMVERKLMTLTVPRGPYSRAAQSLNNSNLFIQHPHFGENLDNVLCLLMLLLFLFCLSLLPLLLQPRCEDLFTDGENAELFRCFWRWRWQSKIFTFFFYCLEFSVYCSTDVVK